MKFVKNNSLFLNIYQLLKISFFIYLLVFQGCRKLIEVSPPITSNTNENVYSTDATAIAVLTGIYAQMSANNNTTFITNNFSSISLATGLSSDELTLYDLNNSTYIPYYKNVLTNLNGDFWNTIYPIIYSVNSAIEGLDDNLKITPNIRSQLLGEAKFMRAFCYFHLINLYGDVPLVLTTNYSVNAVLSRTPIAKVYEQIIEDLKDAKGLLNNNYLDAGLINVTSEKVRPNKSVAASLLAKVYLYTKDYENSEIEATNVINNSSLYGLSSLDAVFLKNSTEAIWQLQPVGKENNSNTGDGKLYILPINGPDVISHPIYLSNFLESKFEIGDRRKLSWIDSVLVGSVTYYYPYKYKIGDVNTTTVEYIMMFRLAEQYLIRAEARAYLNDLVNSESDLNVIRSRAGLSKTIATSKSTLISAIIKERQVELFTEWGNRWFDLKRTATIDSLMTDVAVQKGGVWNVDDKLYPIPASELLRNHNIIQNPSY